jgi:hypothetical protein
MMRRTYEVVAGERVRALRSIPVADEAEDLKKSMKGLLGEE